VRQLALRVESNCVEKSPAKNVRVKSANLEAMAFAEKEQFRVLFLDKRN
jgi:DNA repair protein RadC